MKNKLTKKDIAKIEKETVFSVEEDEECYRFSWYTNAGEDFSFDIWKDEEDIIDAIKQYCFNFDVEEHVKIWFGANRGEPSLRELLDDAEEIEKQLGTLAYVVENL